MGEEESAFSQGVIHSGVGTERARVTHLFPVLPPPSARKGEGKKKKKKEKSKILNGGPQENFPFSFSFFELQLLSPLKREKKEKEEKS